MLTGISATDTPRAEVPVALSERLAGKSGEGLAAAIRKECGPSRLINPSCITYTFHDPFTGSEVSLANGSFPSGYVNGTIVPSEWWSNSDLYGDMLCYDLNNYLPQTIEVLHARGDMIPVIELDEVKERYDRWSIGLAWRSGSLVDAYAPPEEMRGRLARAFFYMSMMYPAKVYSPVAYMMMSGTYPYLRADAATMLAGWSEQYPPDEDEVRWAQYAAGMQGGCNPFVELPDLYEYIWGDSAGLVYGADGERVPLHSTYSLADGDRIDLYSPHVPDDAEWSIDGERAWNSSYEARDLGTGEHTLTYISPSTREEGRVLIRIIAGSGKTVRNSAEK